MDEQFLDNLSVLYQAQSAMIDDAVRNGQLPTFRLNLLFADVLECAGCLTYDNLVRVMGLRNAKRVWSEVADGREN